MNLIGELRQIIKTNFSTVILLISIAVLFKIIFYIFDQLSKFNKNESNIKMNFQLSNFYYKVSYLIFVIIGILLTMFAASTWF
ncbi:hypothetical protein [Halanaerobium congolense]|jgi:hypothetical protein|uniref:Uncharacterized protein n=1 Tax=Halanaerobium congolense TaxID=54121 RepID=A0A4R7DZT5_9FIRM|nr:hypothetical protein [Halanaerobium congolense]TDS28023.1 hypothetical protein BY453_1231 [Halanaerobium congolense]